MRATTPRDAGFVLVFAGLLLLFLVVASHGGDAGGFYTTYEDDTLVVVTVGHETICAREQRYIVISSYKDKNSTVTTYRRSGNVPVIVTPPGQFGYIIERNKDEN